MWVLKKINQNSTKVTALLLTSLFALTACGGGSNYNSPTLSDTSNQSSISNEIVSIENTEASGKLSVAEIQGLLFMREEEELARDLYLDIYAAKDSRLPIFKNISDNSETQHAAAVLILLDKYGIEDPSTGVHNTYTSTELQTLYDQLLNIALGSDDIAALRVGALVEESDIQDINAEIAQVSENHQDIIATYSYLLCGSRNHLRSFVKQIENRTGQDYVTQITEMDSEVQTILSTSQEQCGE